MCLWNNASNVAVTHALDLLTILVLNETVEEDTSHGDGIAREEGVVVHAITDFETSRRVAVASKKGENVVLGSR